ncbi:MAG: hypothetical protein EX269_01360 [Acidimicrobiales bacterium]|nr:MAG: hypothetical protein EX269_01360 [Acidimicrobiales bacterium]
MRLQSVFRAALFAGVLLTSCASNDAQPAGPIARVAESTTTTEATDVGVVTTVVASTALTSTSTTISAPDTSAPDTTIATSTTTEAAPSTTAAPTALEVALRELIPFVEQERGHRFVTTPSVVQLEGDEFVDAFGAVVERNAERYAADYANFTGIYHAMGIISPDENLEQIWASFGDAGVLGFYDREEKQVFLRGREIDEFTKIVLVHELVHALDDQVFGIERPEYDDRDDEISWAFSSVLEGNARYIEYRYRDTLSSAERAAAAEQQRNLPRGASLRSFTESFLELQSAKYVHGARLMDELWDEGIEAVDAVIVSPPSASEQVLHPELVLEDEPADSPLSPPPADGPVFEQGVWGQIGLESILRDELDPNTAQAAAEGWGGDWYVAWTAGSRTCVRLDVAMDTPADLDELAQALEAWSVRGDREIYYPTADLVRLTTCG